MVNYDSCLKELKKVKLCWSELGIRQKAYSKKFDDVKNASLKIDNFTMYDLIFKCICNPKYREECEIRARDHQRKQTRINGVEHPFKLKEGAIGAWSFLDYRYKSSEDFESYNKWLGSQLFDIDFEIKKINKEGEIEGYYTREEANNLSKQIIPRLYKSLCKYEWFAFIDLSTSGKGIHIYTHSNIFDVDLVKNEKGMFTYDDTVDIQTHTDRSRNQFKANYQHKLTHIFDELGPIWQDLGIVQDMVTSVDNNMYRPEQPMNVTPEHEGKAALINPNFKCARYDEIYDEIYNGIVFDNIDNRVRRNLKLVKEVEEHEDECIKKLKTCIKIDKKEHNIKDGSGFYFGHGKQHTQIINGESVVVPTISSVIMTLKLFYTDEEQLSIWKTPGFYSQDWQGLNIEYWIKNFKVINKKTGKEVPKDEWIPNSYVIRFLNKYCGFDIKYATYTAKEDYENLTVYNLKKNEYLSNYWNDILKTIGNKNGIYLTISPTGSGKTKTHIDINNKVRENIDMNMIFQEIVDLPVLCTEPLSSISESKFDKKSTEIITGHVHFSKKLTGTLYVTNYIHFVEDLDVEDYLNFKYIIIDESHLITKESFRSDQLVDFIKRIKEISKKCIVILQTATPMDESKIFDLVHIFKLVKKDKRLITYKYLEYDKDERFSLDMIYQLVRNNIDKGIKTYVYQNNISNEKCKAFANLFDDIDVCIYHKKEKDNGRYEESGMKQLDTIHLLDGTNYYEREKKNYKRDELCFKEEIVNNKYKNYKLLISSVYFGVGNDINDDLEEATCIIIGNNTWQEDIQVFGRFRNAKKINVYEIVGKRVPHGDIDNNFIDYNKLLKYNMIGIKHKYHDITNSSKKVTICGKEVKIKEEADIPLWACIDTCETYHRNKNEKDNHMKEYVDEYSDTIEILEYDTTTVKKTKAFFKELTKERLSIKKKVIGQIMSGEDKKIKYQNVPKLDRWIKIVKRLYYNIGRIEFEKLVNNICGYHIMESLDIFNNILAMYYEDKLDYAEIAAFEHYRLNGDIKAAFMIWYFCHNKGESEYVIMANWYSNFKWKAMCYANMPQQLIDFLFSDVKMQIRKEQVNAINSTSEFLGISLQDEIDKVNSKVIVDYDPIGKIVKFNTTNKSMESISQMIDKYETDKKKDDKKKAHQSSVIVTDKIRESRIDLLSKYKLEVGQVFTSESELATYVNRSKDTISQWKKKNWISNYI